ncbi:MAG TPA: hypothetical protein VMU81_28455 [Acetobacteraceae bacterium]|jgi:hypothetical protein|nr:hypothetical protein [Acetobacteraceae bacterium]
MSEYRIYLLDAADRTCDYRVIRCQDDIEAMSAAADLQCGLAGIEVWAGTRMVQRLSLKESARPATRH